MSQKLWEGPSFYLILKNFHVKLANLRNETAQIFKISLIDSPTDALEGVKQDFFNFKKSS